MSSSNAPSTPKAPLCNLFALRQATRSATMLYDRHLAKAGITTSQHSIMTHIANSPGRTMQEVAEAMVMDRTTLLRALQPLSRDGYVLQLPSPLHARKQVLSLTPAGQAKLAEGRLLWQAAQAEFEAEFGADEATALRAALQKVPRAK